MPLNLYACALLVWLAAATPAQAQPEAVLPLPPAQPTPEPEAQPTPLGSSYPPPVQAPPTSAALFTYAGLGPNQFGLTEAEASQRLPIAPVRWQAGPLGQ
jgi:hypothetical protein